ncbi:Uncharacterised protein [Shigella flexneri]|nr:Uncharacterised protein [Shigella flexneri]
MFVNRGIFLNEGVGTRYIGFRLIVVVVGDEILHRVFREELFHFAIQLGRQRFVGRKYHGWALKVSNDIGNGEGFPGASHAK